MELIPFYKGTFEAFRHNGDQYARLEHPCGYVWFTFDFFTESYQSLDNELNSNPELKQELEDAYREYSASIEESRNVPTTKQIFDLWGACSSPSVFARALLSRWGNLK